jgi:CheY-like chemotaxis protein
MPIMDGYTAARKIREQPRFKDLPVIAMTANAMAGDRQRALDAGMNDHIPKPIDVKKALLVMAAWIRPVVALPRRLLLLKPRPLTEFHWTCPVLISLRD